MLKLLRIAPLISYERTLGDVRLLVQCNYSGTEQKGSSVEGGELLIGNYDEQLVADGCSVLRPYEAVAYIWQK